MSIKKWDEDTIKDLIKNQVEESLHLEYKRSTALVTNERNKNELSKDVSAFANSNGGTIIYGVIEEDHKPKRIDKGIDAKGKKEWIEQVINSRIEPRILDVRIIPISLRRSPGKALFVIEIPIGFTAHQASDLKYYKRFNFQSVPMHNYEVKMVMNRFKEPNLRLIFEIGERKEDSIMLNVYAKNVGKITTSAAHFRLLIPLVLSSHTEGIEWQKADTTVYYAGNAMEVLYFNWGGPTRLPFFPELLLTLSSRFTSDKIWIKPPSTYGVSTWPIYYEIYATDMEPKKGKALLHVDVAGRLSIEQDSQSPQVSKYEKTENL